MDIQKLAYNNGVSFIGMDTGPSKILNIRKMLLIPTKPKYEDVGIRSYNLTCTRQNIDNLTNVVHNSINKMAGGVTEMDITYNVPNMLTLTPCATGVAYVPNGWSTQRLRFLLETENQLGGIKILSYIQGFTEYFDPSLSGLLDPNMNFYINSITMVKQMINPANNTIVTLPYLTYNVMSDCNTPNEIDNVFGPTQMLARPSDVVKSIVLDSRYGLDNNLVYSDHNRIMGGVFTSSSRANNSPTKYLSNVVDTVISAVSNTSNTIGFDSTDDVLDNSLNLLAESTIDSCVFVSEISRITGVLGPSSFTLNLIEAMCPGVTSDGRIKQIGNSNIVTPSYYSFLDSNSTSSTLQPTDSNIKANLISSMLPSIMLDKLITTVTFSLTNVTGSPEVIVTNINSFIDNISLHHYVDEFIRVIKSVLYPVISNNSLSTIELYVDCDILGDMSIGLNIDIQGTVVYRFPTFADSMYSPVITSDNNLTKFKDDVATMLDTTIDTVSAAKHNSNLMIPGDY